MNKNGHTQSLVAAHPGNRNAVKSGVFSPRALEPRIQQLEAAIAELPPQEVIADLLRRELASLAALGEAMDQSLAAEGVTGRHGEPRTLVSLRLRLNEKSRRTMTHYAQAVRPAQAEHPEPHDSHELAPEASDGQTKFLNEMIAAQHDRPSIEAISPQDLDLDLYLRAVILTADPGVRRSERLQARGMLTKFRKNRPRTCIYFSTLRARNELELRDWINELRESGLEPVADDTGFASFVRQIAADEGEPRWDRVPKTKTAFNKVVTEGADRARNSTAHEELRWTGENDQAIACFWRIALSSDPKVTAKERLLALGALEEIGALPRCTCDPWPQERGERADSWCAYTIQLVAKKHYRAAVHIAQYPETYLAVRDAIDARIVSEVESSSPDKVGAAAKVALAPWR